jgi:hypothetical protein
MPLIFQGLRDVGFDISTTYHADAILSENFPESIVDLEGACLEIFIPAEELVRGGGGEARITQRLRRRLNAAGWRKSVFRVEKTINGRVAFSQSHEVDHVAEFARGVIALEVEWNNKDPFFDRDLENFSRLHADGAISVGIIVTRGESLQAGLLRVIESFARSRNLRSFDDLSRYGVKPTDRQRRAVRQQMGRGGHSFTEIWSKAFVADKFGAATTHWNKLQSRLDRGVGSPCPLVAIGIPLSRVSDIS